MEVFYVVTKTEPSREYWIKAKNKKDLRKKFKKKKKTVKLKIDSVEKWIY